MTSKKEEQTSVFKHPEMRFKVGDTVVIEGYKETGKIIEAIPYRQSYHIKVLGKIRIFAEKYLEKPLKKKQKKQGEIMCKGP